MGMGKEGQEESKAFQLAIAFQQHKLTHPVFKIAKKGASEFEKEFPLFFLRKDRQKDRDDIWEQISKLGENTLFMCQSAINCFSKLLIPQYTLNKLLRIIIKRTQEQRDIYTEKLNQAYSFLMYVENTQTQTIINKEIEETTEILKQYKPYQYKISHLKAINHLKEILKIYDILHRIFKGWSENDLKAQAIILGNQFVDLMGNICIDDIDGKYLPSVGRTLPNLIFNTLILIICCELFGTRKFDKRKEAEKLTADLVNEYCYYNPVLESICRKQSQNSIEKLIEKTYYKENALHQHYKWYVDIEPKIPIVLKRLPNINFFEFVIENKIKEILERSQFSF